MASQILLLGILLSTSIISANYVSYKHFKVYKVIPENDKEVQVLNDLQKQNEYNFWTDIVTVGSAVRIMVTPEKVANFQDYMTNVGIKAQVVVEDVQR